MLTQYCRPDYQYTHILGDVKIKISVLLKIFAIVILFFDLRPFVHSCGQFPQHRTSPATPPERDAAHAAGKPLGLTRKCEKRRALPHHALPRPARAPTEHASSAPYRGTDYSCFCGSKLAVLVETPKAQSTSIIQLSLSKLHLIPTVVNKKLLRAGPQIQRLRNGYFVKRSAVNLQ